MFCWGINPKFNKIDFLEKYLMKNVSKRDS